MTDKNQNGKGSKWRKTDFNKYRVGYDNINWSKKNSSVEFNMCEQAQRSIEWIKKNGFWTE